MSEKYFLSEWNAYLAHPERARAILSTADGLKISKVLDIGCGAGQELLPLVQVLRARGVGVDISSEAVQIAKRQFAAIGCTAQVQFACCPAESLPFADRAFDMVTCRLALPYTQNAPALSEMARVLRPGGLLILKFHHARYYLRKFGIALRDADVWSALSGIKVLLVGVFYHLTGFQPKPGILSEVFQSRWMLSRIMRPLGLEILEELRNSDSNPRTPILVIGKCA